MNSLNIHVALLYTTVLIVFAVNVNATVRLNSGERRSYRQQRRRRSLRSEQNQYTEEEDLQIKNSPKEINVDPRSTYNEKFMALMNSPCRPEYDGFFGATSGDPIRIQYGFQVEVEPLSAIMDILDTIEDKIVDSILQSSFPEMCGLRRTRKTQESFRTMLEQSEDIRLGGKSMPHVERPNRSLEDVEGNPSGFKFLKFEEVEKCLPQENEVNFCGIFTGVLYVYGKHQHGKETSRVIMSYINEIFDTSEPHDLHSELSLLSSVEKFSVIEGGHMNQSLVSTSDVEGGLSRLDILMIIVSGLIVVAITYYIYIQWNERRYDDPKSLVGDSLKRQRELTNNLDGLSSHISPESEEANNGKDEFIDDDLEYEPYRDDKQNVVYSLK